MNAVVYALIAVIACTCAVLLARRYVKSGARMLLWSAICFAGLTFSNAILFVDLVMLPDSNLLNLRLLISAASLSLLVFGFIWGSA